MKQFASVLLMSLLVLSSFSIYAADPGHLASSISSGTFEFGNYTFPDSLNTTNFFEAASIFFVNPITKMVGVGTEEPTEALTIIGNQTLTGNIYFSSTGSAIYGDSWNRGIQLSAGNGIVNIEREGGYSALKITSDGTTRVYLDSGDNSYINNLGNLGIGTTTPTHKLSVVGDINATGGIFTNVRNCDSLDTTADGLIVCGSDEGGIPDYTNIAVTNQSNTFVAGQVIDNTSAVNDAYLNISDGTTPKFIVDPAGSLGIGVTPSQNVGIDISKAITTSGGWGSGIKITPTLNAAADNDILYAIYATPTYNNNPYSRTSNIGMVLSVDHDDVSNISNLIGMQVTASSNNNDADSKNISEIKGIRASAAITGDNTVADNVVGGMFTAYTAYNMVGANATNLIAGLFQPFGYGSGNVYVNDTYGVLIKAPTASSWTGEFGNISGLYIEDYSAFPVSENNHNIYSAGINSKNFFEGSVGIGTPSVGDKLDVQGNIKVFGKVHAGDYDWFTMSSFYYTQNSPYYYGGAGATVIEGAYPHDLAAIVLKVKNESDFVVRGSGKVGIGTTEPTHTLNVVGDLNVTGTSYLGDVSIAADNITTNSIISKDGNISFHNQTGGQNMVITETGSVGIGTSNPQALLQLGEGTPDSRLQFMSTSDLSYGYIQEEVYYPRLYMFTPHRMMIEGGWGSYIYATDGAYLYLGNGAGPYTALGYGGSEQIRVDEYGNVGINTTNPSAKLEVVGTETLVNLSDGSGGKYGEVLFINSTNVGIGTASPTSKLEVRDDTEYPSPRISTFFGQGTGGTGAGERDALIRAIQSNLYGGFFGYAHRANYIPGGGGYAEFIITNGGGISDKPDYNNIGFILDMYGNVGINTKTPSNRLHVVGDINTTGTLILNETNCGILSTTADGLIVCGTDGGGMDYTNVAMTNQSNTFTAGQSISNTSDVEDILFNISSGGTDLIYNATYKGRVGIGTAAPTEKLEVAGAIRLSDKDRCAVDWYGSNGTVIDFCGGGTRIVAATEGGSDAANIRFYTDTSGAGGISEAMRITADNLVGIGTSNPSSMLHIVNPNAGQTRLRIEEHGASDDAAAVDFYEDTNFKAIVQYLSTNHSIGQPRAGNLELITFAGEDIAIRPNDNNDIQTVFSSTGNVTIGASGGTFEDLIVYGNLYLDGTTVTFSPFVIQSADDQPIPICMKNKAGVWVGCMPDENNFLVCAPNDECDKKLIRIEAVRSLMGQGYNGSQIDERVKELMEAAEDKDVEKIKSKAENLGIELSDELRKSLESGETDVIRVNAVDSVEHSMKGSELMGDQNVTEMQQELASLKEELALLKEEINNMKNQTVESTNIQKGTTVEVVEENITSGTAQNESEEKRNTSNFSIIGAAGTLVNNVLMVLMLI